MAGKISHRVITAVKISHIIQSNFLVQLGEVTNKQTTEREYRTIKFYISSTDINPKINTHV